MISHHHTLGLSLVSRRRRLYERMEKRSAANAMNGLSTRIPFLKHHLCREGVPNGESVLTEPRRLEKSAPPGHVFSLEIGPSALFRLRPFLEDIARFNGANASSGGVQALLVKSPGRELRFVVTRCDTVHEGDLRMSTLGENTNEDVFLPECNGQFNHLCYGVTLRRDNLRKGITLHHEMEHAQHYSLWHLAGSYAFSLGKARAEYLSMLRELADVGDASGFFQYLGRLYPQNAGLEAQHHSTASHDAAYFYFLQRLLGKYNMSRDDVLYALVWTLRNDYEVQCDADTGQRCAEQFVRVCNAAIGEYNETYARMFGMPIDDLKEVVSRLSL